MNKSNMDELHRELKMQTEACYMTIKEANEKLELIRSRCLHPSSELVDYEERVGRIIPFTRVCEVCGEVIREK